MKENALSTRRRFFWKAGAAMSAPLAIAAGSASARSDDDSEVLQARIRTLEDVNAIRELQLAYARHVNAGANENVRELFTNPTNVHLDPSICGLTAENLDAQDVIELADDGHSATARMHFAVQIQTPIGPSCTLVDMARQQGEGVLRRTDRRVLESICVKQHQVWKIERSKYCSL